MEKIDRNSKEAKSLSLMSSTIQRVENYPNYSYGQQHMPFSFKVDEMLNILYKMTQYTVPELKNYFTVREAAALCDMGNGTGHTPEVDPKISLYHGFMAACEYEWLADKWEIDKDEMLKKLEGLSSFQAYLVQVLTAKFWDNCTGSFTMKEIADLFYIDYEEKVTIEKREGGKDLHISYDLPEVKVPASITVTEENVKSSKSNDRAVGRYEFKYWLVALDVKENEDEEDVVFYSPVYMRDAVTMIILNEIKVFKEDTSEVAQEKVDRCMSTLAKEFEIEM